MNKTEDFFFPENFFGFCLLFRTFVPDSYINIFIYYVSYKMMLIRCILLYPPIHLQYEVIGYI